MRIWLDPQKLYTFGLTPSSVSRVIQEQSQPVTAGQVGIPPAPKGQDFQFTVDVQGRLSTPEEFGNNHRQERAGQRRAHPSTEGHRASRARSPDLFQHLQPERQARRRIAIFQLPNANALDVANRVRAKMVELNKAFPQGLVYDVPFDTTGFVKTSITRCS